MRIDPKTERKIKARVHMSRCYSGDHNYFRLTVEDEASGIIIVEVDLNTSAVADLISSRMSDPQEAKYFANPNIGLVHENQNYSVNLTAIHDGLLESFHRGDLHMDLIQVYDYAEKKNPGWKADRNDYNSNLKVNGSYNVILRRYTSQE